MSRFLIESWQDRRPDPSRRIRWYERDSISRPFRLNCQDDTGAWNIYPRDKAEADQWYMRFRNGEAVGRPW